MITRRLFLGGVVTTPPAAVPLLRTFVRDLDLEVDPAVVELQEGDVLVVRIPEWLNQNEIARFGEELRNSVWPDVLLVPTGVQFQALRRDEVDDANHNNALNFLDLKRR